jgi:hypothetical protein
MSIYYPIEFLPENPELGKPKNRNYLRNNLPYGDSKTEEKTNENNKSIVEYGKKETYLSSSINNTKPSTEFNDLANKTNLTSNVDNKTKKRSTKINIDSRLRNQKPKNILDTSLNNLSNALYFTKNSNILTIYQPNHGLITEDKIVLEFATSKNVKIKQGLFCIYFSLRRLHDVKQHMFN